MSSWARDAPRPPERAEGRFSELPVDEVRRQPLPGTSTARQPGMLANFDQEVYQSVSWRRVLAALASRAEGPERGSPGGQVDNRRESARTEGMEAAARQRRATGPGCRADARGDTPRDPGGRTQTRARGPKWGRSRSPRAVWWLFSLGVGSLPLQSALPRVHRRKEKIPDDGHCTAGRAPKSERRGAEQRLLSPSRRTRRVPPAYMRRGGDRRCWPPRRRPPRST